MKKIKFLIASMIGAIALVFAAILGTKINAATSFADAHDYAYKGSDFYSGSAATSTKNLTNAGIVSFTGKYYPYDSTSGDNKYFTSNRTGETFNFLLVSGGSGRTIVIDNTANTQELDVTVFMVWIANNKGITVANANDIVMTHDDQTSNVELVDGTKYTPDFASEVCKVQTITFTIDAGESTTITPESNIGLLGLYGDRVGSSSTKEEIAVAAIAAIGPVAYTEECSALIASATQKVNACTNGITDIQAYDETNSTSYATTYNNALSTFATLKSTAISNFITAVSNIGTVIASSGTIISNAEAAYAVLFGDALTNDDVLTAKSTLTAARNTYDALIYDSLSRGVNANDLTLNTDGVSEKTRANDSIFVLLPSCKVNTSSVSYDSINYTQRIQTAGKVSFDSNNNVSSKGIEFEIKKPGILRVLAMSASNSSEDAATRTLDIYKSGSKTPQFTSEYLPVSSDDIEYTYITLDTVGVYYISSAVNNISIYNIEFFEQSVTPLVQKATDETYTYVRFVTIVKGVEEFDASAITFSITMEYADTSKDDKTNVYTPHVVKRITSNGNTYEAEVAGVNHTFDNASNPTEYYIVYVARFTTTKFAGNQVYGTVNFGGKDYTSSSITI